MVFVVKGFAVDCSYCGERQTAAVCGCNGLEPGHNFVFIDARTRGSDGLDVHVGCHVAGFFYFGYFLGGFTFAHVYNGAYEVD